MASPTIAWCFLAVAAIVSSATASPVSQHPWNVDYANDGTLTISSHSGSAPRALIQAQSAKNRAPVSVDGGAFSTRISSVLGSVRCYTFDTTSAEPLDGDFSLEAHFNLSGHIYGGPEQIQQYWPLDDVHFEDYSYVTKMEDNQGVADPYWLSSDGFFIFVHPETSLFIDQNHEFAHELTLVSRNSDPYPSPAILTLKYTICEARDAREAHMYAVENYLGKPTGYPDARMIEHPVWSTWARYKVDINESVVQDFADQIIAYGFDNSQLEIDDDWETCYGSLTWNRNKFPDIKGLTDALKAKGYRVTLWIHPFVNVDCEPVHSEGVHKGYFVKNTDGNTTSVWWNGVASAVDFTNPEAVEWWVARLRRLQEEDGIDSFKFDAGETSWLPQLPVLSGELQRQPNLYTEKYVEAVSRFGSLVEVRVAHASQDLPIFVRMLDKDSRWDWKNGLPTLITTLLEMNMVGYPLVLPDMVGGNGYEGAPGKELFVRWLQANVFMPSIQYSYVPWDYDNETVEICQKFTALHAQHAQHIIALLKKAVEDGTPVNPPIWWIAPLDPVAQQVNDEFLLGEDILVAPVVVEGATSRDIYLPRGVWKDEATPSNGLILGPKWLRAYPAPLDVLPYFSRVLA